MNTTPNPYAAYSMARTTTTKTNQLVLLFEGMIKFMMQAEEAIRNNNPETRFEKLTRVTEILDGLQTSIDYDNGGDVAHVLYDFYQDLFYDINYIQRHQCLQRSAKVIAAMKEMLAAWKSVDTEQTTSEPSGQAASSKSGGGAMPTMRSGPVPAAERSDITMSFSA